MALIIGLNESVSKTDGNSCIIEVKHSKPAPVTIFFLAKGVNFPLPPLLHSLKTIFQISTCLSVAMSFSKSAIPFYLGWYIEPLSK